MHIFIITHIVTLFVYAACLFGGFMQSEYASARYASIYIMLGIMAALLISSIIGFGIKGLRSGVWSVFALSAFTVSIADDMTQGIPLQIPVFRLIGGFIFFAIYAWFAGFVLSDFNRFFIRWNVLVGFIYIISLALMIIVGHLGWYVREWTDMGWRFGLFGLAPGLIAYTILLTRIHRYEYEEYEPSGSISNPPTSDPDDPQIPYGSSLPR